MGDVEQGENGDVVEEFFKAVEKGDILAVESILENNPDFDINVIDDSGRPALLIAIDLGWLEIIRILLNHNVDIGDALLYALDLKFGKAVELLLEHEKSQVIVNAHVKGTKEDFHPDITPMVLAAQHNDYESLKLLASKGAPLIELSSQKTEKHTIEHSVGTLQMYKAIASEAYMCFSEVDASDNPDLFKKAFELSKTLREESSTEYEFRQQYEELAERCEQFSADLLDHTRSTEELQTILTHESNPLLNKKIDDSMPSKVLYAVKLQQKQFVAHPHCQQELIRRWFLGLKHWRDSGSLRNLFLSIMIMILFPIFSLFYIVFPFGRLKTFLRVPYIKFLMHTGSYLYFLGLLFASVYVQGGNNDTAVSGDFGEKTNTLIKSLLRVERGMGPTGVEIAIAVFVAGMIWREMKAFWSQGYRIYLSDPWNLITDLQLLLYVCWFVLKLISMGLADDTETVSVSRRDVSNISDLGNHISEEHSNTISEINGYLDVVANDIVKNISHMIDAVKTHPQLEDMLQNVTTLLSKMTEDPTPSPDSALEQLDIVDKRSQWSNADPAIIADLVFAIGNIASVLKFMRVMVASEYVGPLQISFQKMFADIAKFIVLFGVILAAFALGMTQVYSPYAYGEILQCLNDGGTEDECYGKPYAGIGHAMASLFWSLYGMVDLDTLDLQEGQTSVQTVGTIIYGAYSIVAIVILLNLLIALMGTTYDNISGNADTEWKYARSEMWMDYFRHGSTVPAPFNIIPTPKSVWRLMQYLYRKICTCCVHKTKQKKPKPDKYRSLCRKLVYRYFAEKASEAREEGDADAMKEMLMSIKQDVSTIRYENRLTEQKLQMSLNDLSTKQQRLSRNLDTLSSDVEKNKEELNLSIKKTKAKLVNKIDAGNTKMEIIDEKVVGIRHEQGEQEKRTSLKLQSEMEVIRSDIGRTSSVHRDALEKVQDRINAAKEGEEEILKNIHELKHEIPLLKVAGDKMLSTIRGKTKAVEPDAPVSEQVDSAATKRGLLSRIKLAVGIDQDKETAVAPPDVQQIPGEQAAASPEENDGTDLENMDNLNLEPKEDNVEEPEILTKQVVPEQETAPLDFKQLQDDQATASTERVLEEGKVVDKGMDDNTQKQDEGQTPTEGAQSSTPRRQPSAAARPKKATSGSPW